MWNPFRKKNVVEKFRDFYSGLDRDEKNMLYDLLSAIRGPDVRNPVWTAIKYMLTGRIRTLLFPTEYFGVLPTRVSCHDISNIIGNMTPNEQYFFNDQHYMVHLKYAWSILEELGYDM